MTVAMKMKDIKNKILEISITIYNPYYDYDQAPDNMPLYVTVAATFLYFVVPFTIVLCLYLR